MSNHSEGETAIILGLSKLMLQGKQVLVYGSDVDLFVLLLAHYQNIDCSLIYMKSIYTSISSVHDFLGKQTSSALLSFHAITGCDIAGKFSGKSKEFWTKKFLQERYNDKLIQALLGLTSGILEENLSEIQKFFCRSYCPKRAPKRVMESLVETRYYLYKKYSSETSKLPPSPGAFMQHVRRACCPLMVWSSANLNETVVVNHLEHGWEICDGNLMPVSTHDDIAPNDLIALVSCSCNGECSNNHCTCKKNNVACTDFCGCGDTCQNTDMRPPENLSSCEDIEEEDGECDDDEEGSVEEQIQEDRND